MKLIDLQTLCDGDQRVVIEKHDGYCMSVMETTFIKDLEQSIYKDCEIDLISASADNLWIRLD